MFHGAHPGLAQFKGGAAAGVGHQVAIGFNDRFIWEVDSLELDTVTRVGGIQFHIYQDTGMQASTGNTDGRFECMLFIGIEIGGHAYHLSGAKIVFESKMEESGGACA